MKLQGSRQQMLPAVRRHGLLAVEGELEYEEEVRLVAPRSGRDSWNLVRLVPFHREGAGRAGWIGTCIDLTERKSRETALMCDREAYIDWQNDEFFGP